MLAHRKLPWLPYGAAGLLAAAQQDLPKAEVQITQIGRNPIRTFAEIFFCVSHADEAELNLPLKRNPAGQGDPSYALG